MIALPVWLAWGSDCTHNGIPLWGNVTVVQHGEDIKVRVVRAMPDLRVRWSAHPSRCGEWKRVPRLPDFKIRFVSYGQDFDIQFVRDLPGGW